MRFRLRRSVPVVFLCALALLSITVVKSLVLTPTATVASVWTTDTSDVGKLQFDSGETVRIHWQADGTVYLELRYQDDTVDNGWILPPSGYVDYVPQLGVGMYKIHVTGGYAIEIAYGTFFVIPELPLGTILATAAAFGALGLKRSRHIKFGKS